MHQKESKKYTSFRKKMFMVLVWISVIPLVAMFLSTTTTVIHGRLQTISDLQAQAIYLAQEKASGFLDEKFDAFNLVVDVNPSDISEIQKESLEFLMQGLQDSVGDVIEISFINLKGDEVVKSAIHTAQEFVSLRNVFDQPDFKHAVRGEQYRGDVQYTLAGPVVRVASQIENHDRKIIGVISAEISLRRLQGLMARVKLGKTGFVYMLDAMGDVITTSDATFARIGTNLKPYPLIADVMAGNPREGSSGHDRYVNNAGERVIVSGKQFPSLGDWTVFAEWPEQDALGVMNALLVRALIVLMIGMALVVLFSYIISRTVVKPIEQMIEATDAISAGNLHYPLQVDTGDELEKLARHFKDMAVVLQENKRLKDEFVFIAAHELRTPVTAIRGYLSMLLDNGMGTLDQGVAKIITTVQSANDRLVRLVHDLLQIARSDAGKMDITLKPVSLTEVMASVCAEMDTLAQEKHLRLVYHQPTKAVWVQADADKLKELMVNLVSNAIKYTALEGKEIEITHEVQGKEVITHIKDQGIGMTNEDLTHLFAKFYRAKNDYTVHIEGTGLGLFICKEIVERMGGRIWADSHMGKGSVFSFALRIAV